MLSKFRTRLRSSRLGGALLGAEHSVMRVGPGRGLRFMSGASNPAYETGANEIPVQNAIATYLSPGGVFVDIGANVGFFTVIAARIVGPTGMVYAFEPVRCNTEIIHKNIKLNGFINALVTEKAVADREGPGTLVLADYAGGAALDFVDAPPDVAGSTVVDIITLDSFLGQEECRPPTLVKIDVEGAELEVLKGMAGTLKVARPVVIVEVDDSNEEGLRSKENACRDFLTDRGYGVSVLEDSYPDISWHVKHLLALPRTSDPVAS